MIRQRSKEKILSVLRGWGCHEEKLRGLKTVLDSTIIFPGSYGTFSFDDKKGGIGFQEEFQEGSLEKLLDSLPILSFERDLLEIEGSWLRVGPLIGSIVEVFIEEMGNESAPAFWLKSPFGTVFFLDLEGQSQESIATVVSVASRTSY